MTMMDILNNGNYWYVGQTDRLKPNDWWIKTVSRTIPNRMIGGLKAVSRTIEREVIHVAVFDDFELVEPRGKTGTPRLPPHYSSWKL